MNKQKKERIIYLVILVVLILLIAFFSFRAYSRYAIWKDHSSWEDSADKRIEEWMTVNLVLNYFEIDRLELFYELNIADGWNSRRKTLDEIAKENNFKIEDMLHNLNALR